MPFDLYNSLSFAFYCLDVLLRKAVLCSGGVQRDLFRCPVNVHTNTVHQIPP